MIRVQRSDVGWHPRGLAGRLFLTRFGACEECGAPFKDGRRFVGVWVRVPFREPVMIDWGER